MTQVWLELTTWSNNANAEPRKVLVHMTNVTSIRDHPDPGCLIGTTAGTVLHVRETYDEVHARLKAALTKGDEA